jgi:hypothetical protein
MRYCITPTSALFEAVRADMSGDLETLAAFRLALLRTDGMLKAPGDS